MEVIYILLLACFAASIYYLTSQIKRNSRVGLHDKGYVRLRNNYILVYSLMMAGDWLQGPYVYALYEAYGFSVRDIGRLFIAGFGASMIIGTVAGSLADKYGRRLFALIYAAMYAASCLTKHSRDYNVLMLGRLLGGVSTSLLASVFEAWVARQHAILGYDPNWLSGTFAKAVFYGNGVVAIASGLAANGLVVGFGLSPLAPFDLAIVVLALGGGVVYCTWAENFGEESKDEKAKGLKSEWIGLKVVADRPDDPALLIERDNDDKDSHNCNGINHVRISEAANNPFTCASTANGSSSAVLYDGTSSNLTDSHMLAANKGTLNTKRSGGGVGASLITGSPHSLSSLITATHPPIDAVRAFPSSSATATAALMKGHSFEWTLAIIEACSVIRRDPRIFLLGASQALFEAAMYTFIFLWTPAMDSPGFRGPGRGGGGGGRGDDDEGEKEGKTQHGLVFACFMASCMTGSALCDVIASRKSHLGREGVAEANDGGEGGSEAKREESFQGFEKEMVHGRHDSRSAADVNSSMTSNGDACPSLCSPALKTWPSGGNSDDRMWLDSLKAYLTPEMYMPYVLLLASAALAAPLLLLPPPPPPIEDRPHPKGRSLVGVLARRLFAIPPPDDPPSFMSSFWPLGDWIGMGPREVLLMVFCLYEMMVGVFWPSMMALRASYVPEHLKATVINCFRVPLNFLVCLILYNVHAMEMRTMFAICSVMALTASAAQWKFRELCRGRHGGV
eukprot:CAMPEP_0175080296 /NCGR_PEP_ID=MMETSP0052_2-20121109/25415_1 /TAXON_ID=51329 ORGANISM="Polytomella parva, Strain SAG 63-3" /NCGR_SAMPLE_ID=MMETSP0052_2 /ASSEMBLY_ACC=CAM_ASM_000194 /LENGTH=734 /DNA_ID=CAMNT_0016350953 /DNA_START=91 /DNA_END=2295 /DNA_ORIENTATION=-